MADDDGTPQRMMSMVPYIDQKDDPRQMVLRHGEAVVLFDPHSQTLSVTEPLDEDHVGDNDECPTCGRSFHERASSSSRDRHDSTANRPALPPAPFIDQDYFRMLAASRRNTPSSSRVSTPPRPFYRPALRSGRSREVSGQHAPPADSEFISSAPSTAGREGISKSAFSPGYFKQFFVEKRVLGRGGNGVVMLVEHQLDGTSLGEFACKRIPVGDDRRWLEKVLIEVKLLQGIPHRNLVPCHWVWLEDHQSSTFAPKIPCLWMLQEYCNGGDLHQYVVGPQDTRTEAEMMKQRMRRKSKHDLEPADEMRSPSKLPFEDIFSFFKDITSGLHHLHTKEYIHRDLKPSNCLIQWDGARKRVLISDFGEVQAADAKRGSTGATGTISYCAPEVLRRDGPGGAFGDFTTKSDIFSLGMIVYFMCFGRLPYSNADDINEENEDLDELRAEITQWSGFDDEVRLRSDLPEKLYRFLRRLLSLDPNERPSTEEILANIRGGVALEEPFPGPPEDSGARIAPAETRYRSPSIGRQQSTILARPGLSSAERLQSTELVRSRSPPKHDMHARGPTDSRPGSPRASNMTVRKSTVSPPPANILTAPPTPRLMLPPPEISLWNRLINSLDGPMVINTFRVSLFLAKLVSLFLPCSPYAPNSWLLYPLLILAALDAGMLPFEFRRTLLLVGLHLTLATFAFQHGRLCEVQMVLWDDL